MKVFNFAVIIQQATALNFCCSSFKDFFIRSCWPLRSLNVYTEDRINNFRYVVTHKVKDKIIPVLN
jgi:hypothetical protein